MRSEQSALFIEWLDSRSLFFDLIPYFLKRKSEISRTIFVFDASPTALALARGLSRLLNWTIEVPQFELADIKDKNGFSLRLRLTYVDLGIVQDRIWASPAFQDYLRHFKEPRHLANYLAKDLIEFDYTTMNRHRQVLHVLMLVNISRWYSKIQAPIKLFLKKRNWPEILQEYAEEQKVELVFGAPFHNIGFFLKKKIRQILAPYVHWTIWGLRNFRSLFKVSKSSPGNNKYKLGVEYYGQLNLERQDAFSDLFFYKQSKLEGQDIELLFSLPQDPLDETKWQEMQKHNIPALVRFPRASRLPLDKAPIHDPWAVPSGWHLSDPLPSDPNRSAEFEILRKKTSEYNREFSYWKDLFQKGNIRLYTHWYKYDAKHIPMTDAMKSLGGITTIYQRAFESHETRELTMVADAFFCYSKHNFKVEKDNRSDIEYQIVTGFLGDFRFPYMKEKAAEIRQSLAKNGAERIIAFLDENTLDDGRWFTGHEFTRKNYGYFLEQILKDRRYGIIIKPKAPGTLRRRLGPVAEKLDELQNSGRCVFLGGGALQGMYPPVLAALAGDLTIHECLSAGSAGVESALAGVPTFFLDDEGWPVSPLYQLGEGKVVFRDRAALWQACSDFFEKPGAKDILGNCGPLLSELDPFRDGRAAERMGTYLKWLLDGLNSGLQRDKVLADAAERYAKAWGKDKIAVAS